MDLTRAIGVGAAALDIESDGLVTRVRVTGEVDLANAEAIRILIDRHGASSAVELDLTALDYIDSTGVRLLLELGAARGMNRVSVLVDGRGPVRRVLEIVGLDALLSVADRDARF
jgi:anti-anti-sigma factor